jgi:hypothetical protein
MIGASVIFGESGAKAGKTNSRQDEDNESAATHT